MAGHSKWANIKRRKAAQDQKKGRIFSKLSKAITVAAKNGGDPDANLTLKYAIDKAKQANMPAANIDQAIKKGTGEIEGVVYTELLYEGRGPGGVAIMLECLSDNRNRTTPEVKKLLEHRGGSLGAQGSAAFMFTHRGIVVIKAAGATEDQVMEAAMEAGADDYEQDEDDVWVVKTDPKELHAVRDALAEKGWEIDSAELQWEPNSTVDPEPKDREKIETLLESLEDYDDTQNVFSNLEPKDDEGEGD